MKSDMDLKKDVMDELAWEPLVNEARIGVAVKNGLVTLSGHPSSYAEKVAAERAALRVSGVKAVAVELDVQMSSPYKRTDEDIASAANTALTWNSIVPRDAVKIMVEDGVVTLSGEVEGDFQRRAAENSIRPLMGIKGIRNTIKLRAIAASKDIKSKISAALHRQAQIDAQNISVTVDGSHVTLNGKVTSWAERQAAMQAALAAPGVSQVVDHMDMTA